MLLACDEATTLLREEASWNGKVENVNSQNLLLKGDNLEVLKHLSHAYYEKVKMIYIDPPYNTGSDGFVYQDDRKFSVEELQQLAGVDEDKARRILKFTQSKSNSHSAWLTFNKCFNTSKLSPFNNKFCELTFSTFPFQDASSRNKVVASSHANNRA
jgi:adenine-specific DNA-methyltransferase